MLVRDDAPYVVVAYRVIEPDDTVDSIAET